MHPVTTPSDVAAARPCAPPLDFDDCYQSQADFVWRSLRHLGVDDGALDDATQEVFLVVHRRLAGFDGASLRAWLFTIALNVARDHRRARRRRGPHTALPEDLSDRAQDPSEVASRRQALALLRRLLDALDDDRRAVFVMVECEQLTVPEAAEALGVNVNTVYSRLRAARQQFDAALSRHQARTR